jgi:hypothetical protein
MFSRRGAPRGDQAWHTFARNHAKEVSARDFLTQYTAFFPVAYVFVIMEVGSRRIVHVNVTTNPTLAWVKQQIREATRWGSTPRFLIHDNDGRSGCVLILRRSRQTKRFSDPHEEGAVRRGPPPGNAAPEVAVTDTWP